MATTLPIASMQQLTVSKIDGLIKKIDGKIRGENGERVKTETARLALNADKKRLVEAKQKIVDWVKKQKQIYDRDKAKFEKANKGTAAKFDPANDTKSKWVANWRTTITYAEVFNPKGKAGKGQIKDAVTKGIDYLDDKKEAIAAIGAGAAIAGAAITYLPKLMSIETGVMVENAAGEMVAQTVGQVIATFLKSHPALSAGLGVAGIAAIAVAIPTIRNKIRNSERYKGKIEARAEAAELDAEILALDEKEPKNAVNYYVNSAIKFDKDQNLEIPQDIIDMVAGDLEVMTALSEDLQHSNIPNDPKSPQMSAEQRLKLRTLLNRAVEQRKKIEAADVREQNRATIEAQIALDVPKIDQAKLDAANKKLAEAKAKWEEASKASTTADKEAKEKEARDKEKEAIAELGIDASKYTKNGVKMISDGDLARKLV
ncbi:MAG: hypothetical protein J6J33_04260, partial [Clostridia bacterium]|nr:hypothetical protein [Clostridia bacterium]